MNTTKKPCDYQCQLLIIGDSTVGKSSILSRYNNMTNDPLNQIATVGIDYFTKDVTIDNSIIRTKLWDTAGQERYRSFTNNFFKSCNGIVLVFDLNARETYDNLKHWIQSINLNVEDKSLKKILIGNKSDLEKEVKKEEVEKFAMENNMEYFESSAKNNININEPFIYIIKEIYESGKLKKVDRNSNNNNSIKDNNNKSNGNGNNKKKSKCC